MLPPVFIFKMYSELDEIGKLPASGPLFSEQYCDCRWGEKCQHAKNHQEHVSPMACSDSQSSGTPHFIQAIKVVCLQGNLKA